MEKIAKFRGIFRDKFAEKLTDFAGFSREKKSKFAEKLADFVGFSQEKSQNSQKKTGEGDKYIHYAKRGHFMEMCQHFCPSL